MIAGRREIVPRPGDRRRGSPRTVEGALAATQRVGRLAGVCRERLACGDPTGVRRTLSQIFDALEQIEAALDATWPPSDPGRLD